MDWLELARILAPAAVAFTGLGIAALRVLDRHLHRRAVSSATPEQLAALAQMPQPSPLLRRGGPALVLFAVGGTLASWLPYPRDAHVARSMPPRGDFLPDQRPRGLPLREADHVQD